ncbi:L,D-transpeptidase family protein [Aestuariivirga litoralis]|nr:L,D-transpeptidase family protein [Aestuariivirga litoralis]MBG1233761.1 L,D-transpeptidase family protein [Aestuariivirga litoralis]
MQLGHRSFRCILGKNGQTFFKREGDGKSPKGRWKLEQPYFRQDRQNRFKTPLKMKPLKPNDGWCDAKGHKDYNRKIRLPFVASHENLWRDDTAYDLLFTTDHNRRPRVQGGGSAIFFHLIRDGATFTEGCVALSARDMKLVLAACSKHTCLVIR